MDKQDRKGRTKGDGGYKAGWAAGQGNREKKYVRWQEKIAALEQIALESTDATDLFNQTASRLAQTLGADCVEILQLSDDGVSLVLRGGFGWANNLIGSAKAEAGVGSQAAFTLLANEPIIVENLKTETRFTPPALLLNHGIVSGITVAIGGRPRAYGVLGVHSQRHREFSTDDVQFLRTVASVLATAVRGFEADQAQRDGAARVRAIVDTLVDGIITIDERGKIESLNPAAQRIFGYSVAEVAGQNVKLLMPAPYQREHDGYLANYLRTGTKRIIGSGREVSGMRKDGTTFPLDLAVSEFHLSGRRMFTGVVRDITDRRRLEQEILEAGADEQRRIGQDLHDGLCQHLAGTAFLTEVLSQKLSARSAPETDSIRKVGEMIDQAITQARDFARGLQPVTLDANGLVVALEALVEKVKEMFHVSCAFVCDGSCLVHDINVATHLYRIAQEAISNAVKHGRARSVTVELSVSATELILMIRDDGIGFSRTVDDSPGMGLRTMGHRARVIGGDLRIQPDSNRGTIVSCAVRNKGPSEDDWKRLDHGKEKDGKRKTTNKNPRRGRPPDRS